MKKNLLIVVLSTLFSAFCFGQTLNLPVNFENSTVNYYGLTDFGGNVSEIVIDPTNSANHVVKTTKTVAAELWAGTTVGGTIGFATPIPFAAGSTSMSVKVWSPTAGTPIRLKVENAGNPTISVETEALTTVASAWQTLIFNFSNQASGTAAINFANTYNKASIFFNFGTTGAIAGEKIYFWDDMEFVAGPPPPVGLNLPVNFEDTAANYYGLTDFGGNVSEIVVDPTNATNHVVKTIKTATAELWAGTTVGGTVGFATPIPFAAGSTSMSVKVWSPTAGTPIRLKVENSGNAAISVETEALTTVASAWQTLIFNFSNQASGTAALNLANSYNKASIFFNFGTTGATAGEKIYFWDDMQFAAAPPPVGLNLPVNFEDTAANYYGLTDFGGNVSEIVADPTNAANHVVKSIKTAAAELWAGTTVGGTVGFATPIPFVAGSTSMSVKVWSPTAGTPIRLKVENSGNAAISVETEALTTVASAWQTLIFNFSNQASGTAALNLANSYNKASIFFNFGTTGTTAGEKIYFWDDIEFVTAPPPVGLNLPVNFEDTAANYYGLTDFGGNASEIVVDPTSATNHVVKTIKTAAAELWAGTTVGGTVGFTNPIPFVTGSTSMRVRVWSPTAGTPIRMKVENSSNAAISVETEALTTAASAWQTLVFEFSNHASGTAALNLANSYNKASIFFNFGTTGATAGEKTYYWDDMEFATAPPPPGLNLPVNFEDTIASIYGLTDFGGNVSEIVVDPTNASNHAVKTIKTAGAELWAGTTVGGTVGFANPIPFAVGSTSMSVRVWSPTAGTPIRLKVEKHNDPTISVETEALTTVASAWQTLAFNFSNQAAGTAALNLANSYNKASIFFNFGTTGASAGEQTYYWDDMEFGNTINVTEIDPGINVSVFPNPAENTLYINSKTTLIKITVFNVVGKQIKEFVNELNSINVSELTTGVYIIKLTDINGKTVISKFIKK